MEERFGHEWVGMGFSLVIEKKGLHTLTSFMSAK